MPYKVLVTTWCSHVGIGGHSSKSVHTVVLEFESQQAAETAVKRVNENKHPSDYNQRALGLW